MVSKNQLLTALDRYIASDMIPNVTGNYKVILKIARAALAMKPDVVFQAVRSNPLVTMLDLVDEADNVDLDTLVQILSEGLSADEFTLAFHLLGKDYAFHFSADDVRKIKSYI